MGWGTPKIDCFGAAKRCSPQYVEIDRPIFGGRVRSFVGRRQTEALNGGREVEG